MMSFLASQQAPLLTDWPYGSAIASILPALSGAAVLIVLALGAVVIIERSIGPGRMFGTAER